MPSKLNEGLRPGDLEDLVLPMITVDEYESKIDDNAIVIGFYVHDKDAAEDLNRYVQKSPIQLLDTEVSPAPDQHGYYIVFVEIMNDQRIVDNIEAILEEISPLTSTEEWQMRVRGSDDTQSFSAKVLSRKFAKMRSDVDYSEETENKVMEFFKASDLSNVIIENNHLKLVGHDSEYRAEIVDFGNGEKIVNIHNLSESAISLDMRNIAETLKLTRLLGDGWLSAHIGDHCILQRNGSDHALLLKNARFM